MKANETPFLNFYNRCVEFGAMPVNGLCAQFHGNAIFTGFIDPEFGNNETYWGFEFERTDDNEMQMWYEFTPLRQNVVLLCAAINNEL